MPEEYISADDLPGNVKNKTLDTFIKCAKVSNCKNSTLYIKGEVNGSFKKSDESTGKNK